jgi:hypothetical protein
MTLFANGREGMAMGKCATSIPASGPPKDLARVSLRTGEEAQGRRTSHWSDKACILACHWPPPAAAPGEIYSVAP